MPGKSIHVEPNQSDVPTPQQPQYETPFAVSISFPEHVTIRMVDATALNDYEVLLFFSSLFFSMCIGFGVAYAQDNAGLLLLITVIFGAFALGFFGWAMVKRNRMKAKSREFRLQTSGVQEVNR